MNHKPYKKSSHVHQLSYLEIGLCVCPPMVWVHKSLSASFDMNNNAISFDPCTPHSRFLPFCSQAVCVDSYQFYLI